MRTHRPWIAAMVLAPLLAAAPARAGEPHTVVERMPVAVLCDMLELRARQHGLPGVFFVRLIWRESAFDPNAVSHKGAQGIAQFMPGTAAERGLADPFDPARAVAASAALLSDLAGAFGNWGLAAAAYNAGAERVRNWLAGRTGLPLETRNFVRFITGRTAEDWKEEGTELLAALARDADPLRDWCRALPVRAPSAPPVAVARAPAPCRPAGGAGADGGARARARTGAGAAACGARRGGQPGAGAGAVPTPARRRRRVPGEAQLKGPATRAPNSAARSTKFPLQHRTLALGSPHCAPTAAGVGRAPCH